MISVRKGFYYNVLFLSKRKKGDSTPSCSVITHHIQLKLNNGHFKVYL